MNWKKALKIIGYSILVILIFGLVALGYLYYQTKGKYPVDKEKYPQYIGKIDTSKEINTDGFEFCGRGRIRGYYHSAAPTIYKGSKLAFRKMIQSNFNNNQYTDQGYLSLRFNINCDGKTGNVIITELNPDLEKTTLNQDLVSELYELSIKEENWQTTGEDLNYYMYLLFKIENGKVTEILP